MEIEEWVKRGSQRLYGDIPPHIARKLKWVFAIASTKPGSKTPIRICRSHNPMRKILEINQNPAKMTDEEAKRQEDLMAMENIWYDMSSYYSIPPYQRLLYSVCHRSGPRGSGMDVKRKGRKKKYRGPKFTRNLAGFWRIVKICGPFLRGSRVVQEQWEKAANGKQEKINFPDELKKNHPMFTNLEIYVPDPPTT